MNLRTLAIPAAALLSVAAPAGATTITFVNNVAVFTNQMQANTLTPGTYTDTYDFDLTGYGSGWSIAGDVASHFVTNLDGSTAGDITFTSIALDGSAFDLTSTGANEDYRLISRAITPTTHQLVLTYNTTPNGTGSVYTGQLDITGPTSAVPEPASWLLMLSGFGMLGAALRRNKAIVRFA